MVWYLSRLQRLNGIQKSWVQIPLRPPFHSYLKESVSGEYHMYEHIPQYLCDYLQKTLIKINLATDKNKQPKWNVTLNKRWKCSSCTKLALSASWTHGWLTQWVRPSEQNALVVGSNLTQANFLKVLQCIRLWWIPYVSTHSATLMWLPTDNFD